MSWPASASNAIRSFRGRPGSSSSFLAFFGLSGWYGVAEEWSSTLTVFAAFACGGAMMFVVAWLMAQLRKLYSQGNLDTNNAVGRSAVVYLRIPATHGGLGKITVEVQGRTVELRAQTAGPELATGTMVRVVARRSGDVFDVEALV